MSGTSPAAILAHNERTKLSAGALNTLATSSAVVGGVTPAVASLYGLGHLSLAPWQAAIYSAMFIVAGAGLHVVARRVLGGLKE